MLIKHFCVLCGMFICNVAFAQTETACIFSPSELSTTLGQTPDAGVASKDRLGLLRCEYKVKKGAERGFSVLVRNKCDQKRLESNAKLKQSLSGKPLAWLKGYGDGAYFSQYGSTAAVRVDMQCIELSGFRHAGTNRPITEADVDSLLKLAVTRVKGK